MRTSARTLVSASTGLLGVMLSVACADEAGPGASGSGGSGGDAGAGGQASVESGLDERPPNPDCVPLLDPPELLSDHPCFAGDPPAPGPALVPYTVRAPLWSDGADKQRYIALPEGAAFEVRPDGDWLLPPGGVLVKEFEREGQRLETRLLARSSEGEDLVFTYVWEADGSDAVRTDGGAIVSTSGEDWVVPSQDQCLDCHTQAAGVSLGLETRQLATRFTYPSTGRSAEQLATLSAIGFIPPSEDEVAGLPEYEDESVGADARARAYLHANCSHCHRPGGTGGGDLDLRYQASLPAMGLCDVVPETGDPTPGQDGRLLSPGDTERSVLFARLTSEDSQWRMPPLGTGIVDEQGAELVRRWIEGIETCP